MASVISYVDIIELMTSIAQRHYQINTFFLGRDWEVENNQDVLYPLFQVYPEFAKMPINDWNEYKTLELTLNCKVLDITTPGEENEKDVHSDTLRIAQDIVNELNQHPFYIRSNVSLMEDISFNALEEHKDDITAGWSFSLKLKIINANTFCGMPIAELAGVSANGPTSQGTIVNVQYLTCNTLPDCPTIIDIDLTLQDLQEQIDNLPPSALTLAQVLGYGNSTGGTAITSNNGNQSVTIGDSNVNIFASIPFYVSNLIVDGSQIALTSTLTKITSNQVILTSTDNASVNIVSPAGFFYPSLNFFNQGTNLLGQISGYAGQLYLSGVSGTPLIVNSAAINLPLQTINTLLYLDGGNNVQSVTLGSGLSLVGNTLSASTPSLSGTAPIVYTAGVISITQATTSTNGYLSSTDWNTFNNKQNALGFTPENVANKATTFVTLNNTLYPTTQAVANYVTAFGYITSSALAPYLTSATAASTYVPYTGATTDLDMGTHMASADTLRVTGTTGTGYLRLPNQSVTPSAPTISLRMFADSLNRLSWIGLNGYTRTFDGTSNTANRIYVLPDNSGTVALISDLTTGYVPYTGATTNVNLGSNNFTVTGNITTGMSGSASRVVEAGSGGALTATKDIIDGFLLAGSAPAILLTNVANWTAKVYTGTAITGTFQGQQFFDNNYYFVAVNDNDWIRTARA